MLSHSIAKLLILHLCVLAHLQDNTADPKQVPTVDLLFGVDDDLVSPTGFQSEVKAKAPDILDFVDVPYDLPEVSVAEEECHVM